MPDETTPVESDDFTEDLTTETWPADLAGPGLVARLAAEATGTFILVLIGAGTAAMAAVTGRGPLDVGLAYGIALMIGIVAWRSVSGAHFNPAVTVGAWLSGRFPGMDVVPYILAQVVGGILAAGIVRIGVGSLEAVTSDSAMSLMGAVSAGYGEHAPLASSGLNFSVAVALTVEALAAGLLTLVVLGAAAKRTTRTVAPFAIGLTFAVLMMWAIPFTNGALNPARATATALFSDTWALQQLWAWWLAPVVGAAIVGLLYRIYGSVEEPEVAEESAEA
ncbi:aquaporin [Demequina sp.]|uniref:aquaporin n=1 Tax=Demequina sp. TaxID=2050685 RepID=UPI0025BBEB12|nr:aquaporin [Demequina sp.]